MTGTCRKRNPFRGIVTISGKGQMVVPSPLREELDLKRGTRLIILKRKDDQGFTALKEEALTEKWEELLEIDGR